MVAHLGGDGGLPHGQARYRATGAVGCNAYQVAATHYFPTHGPVSGIGGVERNRQDKGAVNGQCVLRLVQPYAIQRDGHGKVVVKPLWVVAVMVAFPPPTAFTLPLVLTVATSSLLLDRVTVL